MRRFLGSVLDKTLVNLVYHVESRVKLKKGTPNKPNVYDELKERAIKRSADYVEAHLPSVLLFYNRKQMWDYATSQIILNGLNIEFGVHKGDSINYLAQKLNSRGAVIFGFDSFEGLREDWKASTSPKGTFNLGGVLPPVRPNVTLVKGWFDKTLPPFLAREAENVAFVHLDADTYETTLYLLTTLNPRIVPGTLLLFDEYIGYPGWEHGEFKAFKELVEKESRPYEYLAFSHLQALVRIK
jgi:hypothetical protein